MAHCTLAANPVGGAGEEPPPLPTPPMSQGVEPAGRCTGVSVFPALLDIIRLAIVPVAALDKFVAAPIPMNPLLGTPVLLKLLSREPS